MDDENDFIDMPAPRRSAPQTNPTNATNARPQFSRRQRVHHTPRDVVNLPIQPVRLHDPRTTIQRLELKIDLLDGNPSNEPLRDVDATILLDDLNKLEAFWMKLPSVQSRDQFLNTVLQSILFNYNLITTLRFSPFVVCQQLWVSKIF
jgi:hypothetical protein